MREISAETIRIAKDAGVTIAAGWLPGLQGVLSSSGERQQAGLKEANTAIEIGTQGVSQGSSAS